ncbi:glycosyltransferase family 4 protein [Candidatus Gracilibacteria bacterium]|nr:glycosyltransferase family 4 protein [Candidatus Gracilibacteria bacterium]
MKILFILELFQPHIGGVEILFDNLIKGLISKGNSVTVLTSKFKKDLPSYEKISDKLEIYRVGHNRYDFMFYCISKGIKLAKKCDIIHTTTYNAAIPASIISKITNKKIVITVHEIFGKLRYRFLGWKGFFFKLYESLIFKFNFDKFICVSNYTKNSLRIYCGLEDNKLITVYNGLDYDNRNLDNFKQEDIEKIIKKYNLKDNYIGLFFGRSGISKGLKYFIQAIPDIIKKIPKFKAILIVSESSNNKADYERKLINKLNIKNNIIRVPGVKYKELGNYILASDFVIVPSLVEGFGFSAAETCTLNKNLIVSNIASLPEVVSGKINFVEPANSEDISNKVVNFYNNKYQIIQKKEFLWSSNVNQTLDIYKEILGK